MLQNRDEKKTDLKNRLIDAAEVEIAEQGLSGLKARAVTTRAGCALGAIYTAVEDLDMLVLMVNLRTLARLGAALKAQIETTQTPQDALQALAAGYTDFAIENRRLWRSLFEHRLPEGRSFPDWYREAHAVLLEVIAPHLAALRPDLTGPALNLRTRTTFAAVHGVVLLALQGRFVGVPLDMLHKEVKDLVDIMTAGSAFLWAR